MTEAIDRTTSPFHHQQKQPPMPAYAGFKNAPKNIVLCFDGTESKFGPAPYTNALKLFRLLDKDDPTEQICYYQPGIGASMTVERESLKDLGTGLSNTIDSLIAFSLDIHIMEAYKFLMKFYCRGDKIYFFGFSRGAFTTRVLSSMIERVGLLNPGLEELVEGAWSIYSAWEYAAQPSQPDYTTTLVDEFKKTFTRVEPAYIEFMGIFDTVNSVGILRDRMFPFTTRFNQVKQIRHAVSLDERRTKFKQNLIFPYSYKPHIFSLTCSPTPAKASCDNTAEDTQTERTTRGEVERETTNNAHMTEARRLMSDIQSRLNVAVEETLQKRPKRESVTSSVQFDKTKLLSGDFQELWFAGNHGDVGGGWEPDIHGQFLSNVPLRWILSEAVKAGVLFQKDEMTTFAERYSSLDSFLSPDHDLLSLRSYHRTLAISKTDQEKILNISNKMFGKGEVPQFRSCESKKKSSYTDLFNSGVYLTSLKRLQVDLNENMSLREAFEYYKQLPDSPVSVFDGHGNCGLWRTLFWWSLELVPVGTKIENEDGEWKNVYVPNLGRRRSLPAYAQLHWSVFWRMKYCLGYNPTNLPHYANMIWSGADPVDDNDDALTRKVIEDTQEQFKEWDAEKWRVVPDDLQEALQAAGYYDSYTRPTFGPSSSPQ